MKDMFRSKKIVVREALLPYDWTQTIRGRLDEAKESDFVELWGIPRTCLLNQIELGAAWLEHLLQPSLPPRQIPQR